MTGHHEVKTFWIEEAKEGLPSGWKPFAVEKFGSGIVVFARKWIRDEKTTQEEEPET